jgi:hypothetical protein
MNCSLKYFSVVVFICSSLASCVYHSSETYSDDKNPSDSNPTVGNVTQQHADSSDVSVKTFQQNTGWGYDIFANGKLYIHQPNIPAVSGNDGFKSEADAKRAGEFVAYKIRNNIMPPSVTPEELDSLGVIQK